MADRDPEPAFPRLRPASLRVNVADLLRSALLQRRFEPGEELADSALAKEFGVSRGPIREALIILAEEGVIEHLHYRGFRVPRLTANDILQINEARLPLEAQALRLARPRTTPKDISALHKLKDALLKAYTDSPEGRHMTAQPDYEFHSYVWQLSGNPWLVAGLKRICLGRFLCVSAKELGFAPQDFAAIEALHQQYIDYLSGELDISAEECVARHLQSYQESKRESA